MWIVAETLIYTKNSNNWKTGKDSKGLWKKQNEISLTEKSMRFPTKNTVLKSS